MNALNLIRTMYRGTVEYLEISIAADEILDAQPVSFSFDRDTWHPAEWDGVASTTRTARLLLGSTVPLPVRSSAVYVRLTDNPEIPVMRAGLLRIR